MRVPLAILAALLCTLTTVSKAQTAAPGAAVDTSGPPQLTLGPLIAEGKDLAAAQKKAAEKAAAFDGAVTAKTKAAAALAPVQKDFDVWTADCQKRSFSQKSPADMAALKACQERQASLQPRYNGAWNADNDANKTLISLGMTDASFKPAGSGTWLEAAAGRRQEIAAELRDARSRMQGWRARLRVQTLTAPMQKCLANIDMTGMTDEQMVEVLSLCPDGAQAHAALNEFNIARGTHAFGGYHDQAVAESYRSSAPANGEPEARRLMKGIREPPSPGGPKATSVAKCTFMEWLKDNTGRCDRLIRPAVALAVRG